MRLRLNEGVLTSYNPGTGEGYALVKVIDEEQFIVEIAASRAFSGAPETQEPPYPEERWTLIDRISPKYLAHAVVEIIEPDRGGWKVKLIHTHKPMPRNAQFSRTFTVRRNHLAARA